MTNDMFFEYMLELAHASDKTDALAVMEGYSPGVPRPPQAYEEGLITKEELDVIKTLSYRMYDTLGALEVLYAYKDKVEGR